MHPDLLVLQQNYNHVLDEYEAKHLSYDEAMDTLRVMTAVDSDGWIWSVDPDSGNFIRQRPGGAAEFAGESLFVAAQFDGLGQTTAPVRPQTPLVQAPGGYVDLNQPPVLNRDAQFAPPGPGFADRTPRAGSADVRSSSGETSSRERRPRVREARVRQSRSVNESSFDLSSVRDAVRGKERTLVLVIAAIVVVALLIMSGGASSPSSTTAPSNLTGPAPTTAQAVRVLDSLVHGAPYTGLVRASSDVGPDATAAAMYAGVHSLGWKIATTPPAVSGGSYVSNLSLYSGTHLLAQAQAQWVLLGGTWELAAWPNWH